MARSPAAASKQHTLIILAPNLDTVQAGEIHSITFSKRYTREVYKEANTENRIVTSSSRVYLISSYFFLFYFFYPTRTSYDDSPTIGNTTLPIKDKLHGCIPYDSLRALYVNHLFIVHLTWLGKLMNIIDLTR